uniref:TRF2/HOY1 PH-like domain-containing protein n=1 Tax=Quercus lobata TaxID=97700 RepID=A0A7N2L5J5_QUELO
MEELVEILGCKQPSLPLKYLGLPLGATHKEETIWNLVLEKMERRLARWKMMYLSKGGKVALIKNTLSSLRTFFLSLCPIPVKVANHMEKLQRDFLWSGIDAPKIPLVEWAKEFELKLWKISSDFTDNQAQTYRLHYLEFPPGTLDKHYEKLLQCDPNLLKLSQRPFPSLSSPYFHTDCNNGRKEFSLDIYRHVQLPLPFSSMHSPFKSIQQIQAYEQAHQQYLLTTNSTSPISVMDFSPHSDGAISNQGVDDPRMAMWEALLKAIHLNINSHDGRKEIERMIKGNKSNGKQSP